MVAVQDGLPVVEDGRLMNVANVVWCTGYRPAYDWVHLDVFDQQGQPVQDRGVTPEPGLYFIGLFFLASAASSLVGGVGHDAQYIARQIAAPLRSKAWITVPS
jgi:putative flavoprotein involved in K+ transport